MGNTNFLHIYFFNFKFNNNYDFLKLLGKDHTEIFNHTSSCHLIFLLDWEIINNFGKVIYILGNNIHVGGKAYMLRAYILGVILKVWEIKTKIGKQLNILTLYCIYNG